MSAAPPAAASHAVPASSLLLVVILTLVWGCNWPVLKLGVTELAPLTFRATTLGLAALGLLVIAKLSGAAIRLPRALWLLHEPLSSRKLVGLLVGMGGMAILLGEDIVNVRRAPVGALLVIGAAISWGFGTVLLRRWSPSVPQTTLTGWMMLLGWIPLLVAAPLLDPHALSSLASMSGKAWFAVIYNIFFAGSIANWAWFRMARSLPVAVSSLSSLPVPVVGVFSGMLFLGERPGASEFIALALVLASLAAVMLPERR